MRPRYGNQFGKACTLGQQEGQKYYFRYTGN